MNLYAPDYYPKFKCIAEKCKHSCCVGWEIEIDEETNSKYENIHGDFGEKLKQNIISTDGSYVFKQGDDERCPFLSKTNLCDIILNLGEENLCQICTDHPRFRNFYTNHTEIGLGLACEAAAELILNKETKTNILPISNTASNSDFTENEIYFFETRNKLFEIAQNRNNCFADRFCELCEFSKITIPNQTAPQWAKELLTLEQLDEEWTNFLKNVPNKKSGLNVTDTQMEQLLVYFIFRHTSPDALSDGIRFALVATDIITKLTPHTYDFINLCRMFSSEIEYSEENTDYIMNY